VDKIQLFTKSENLKNKKVKSLNKVAEAEKKFFVKNFGKKLLK
jgi:hypothetical protein